MKKIMKKMNKISINLWDDFYEETYMYIEGEKISNDLEHEYLNLIFNHIINNIQLDDNINVELVFNDTKNKYSQDIVDPCLKEMCPDFFFKRWEIRFNNISHKQCNILLNKLKKSNLYINDNEFRFYSES
jgi:hypothetical protein